MDEVEGRAVEHDAAFVQDEEGGVGLGFTFGKGFDALALVGIAVRGEHECILQAVGYEQGRGVICVALLEDELDDGGGGDGVEAAGG